MPDDGGRRTSERRLPLLWLDQIEPVLDAQDFVQGVLVQNSAIVAYGAPNAGKTFWVTDLALHVAAGERWNGRRVDQGGVIYCVLEGGNGFRNRVSAWRDRHKEGRARRVPFAAIPSALNLLDRDADTDPLIEAIRAAAAQLGVPIKLVVIDTLSRALAGGNENAPDDMGALVRNMDLVRQETGAAVLFVHHSGKDAARGARGHNIVLGAIDTEIEVVSDEDSGLRTATVSKQRDLPKGAVFGFQLEMVTVGQNQHGEDVTTCLVEPEVVNEAVGVKGKGKTTLTKTERGWLDNLHTVFAEDAPDLRAPLPDMKPVLTLTREQITAGLRRHGRVTSKADEPLTGTERTSMSKYLNLLRDKRKIGITAEFVWLL